MKGGGRKAITGARWRRAVLFAAAAVLAGAPLSSGCDSVGTALFIRVQYGQIRPVTQLRVTGQTVEGVVFGPFTRPETAGGPLAEGQTVRVLLPDLLGGKTVRVSVHGLSDGSVVALGEAETTVKRGEEVSITVRLAPLSSAVVPACSSCLTCCLNGTCRPRSVTACAPAGEPCQSCDQSVADSCSMAGACQCGAGPSCPTWQRCQNGACR
jgi:hypothetical protein